MDSAQQVAISKIAEVLSDGTLIPAAHDIWKKIFYNSNQMDTYDDKIWELQPIQEFGSNTYIHNNRCYSALHEILTDLFCDKEAFIKLLSEILLKLNKYTIFMSNVGKSLGKSSGFDISDYLLKNDYEKNQKILNEHPSKAFKCFRSNLNILGLDLCFDKEDSSNLIILPFEFIDKKEDKSLLINWLQKHPNILRSYEDAIKAYGSSNPDPVATLVHCRNIITGIFCNAREEHPTHQYKWLKGLQHSCKDDKNINNVTPNAIPKLKIIDKENASSEGYNSLPINEKYNYPRFRTIYQLYSYLSDLGAHINEGPLVNGATDCETVTMSDALLGLRMTEDVLIWLYQDKDNKLNFNE